MPTLPLGLAQVAAAVRQHGHEVLYLDLLGETAPESAIQRAMQSFVPEVVGISIRNIDNQDMQEPVFLLDRVKDLGSLCRTGSAAPIVVGGAGYRFFLPLHWHCWAWTTALLAKASMHFRCSSKGLGNGKKSPAYLGFRAWARPAEGTSLHGGPG